MSKVYTVPSLADRWQCSKWFVYEQIRTGRLQAVRFGGKLLRVTDAEVAAITGQSRQMVEHYARLVNQERLARTAILKWEAQNG